MLVHSLDRTPSIKGVFSLLLFKYINYCQKIARLSLKASKISFPLVMITIYIEYIQTLLPLQLHVMAFFALCLIVGILYFLQFFLAFTSECKI
jgi:hypothetical protein